MSGDTSPPPAQDDVDLHYACFVKSSGGLVYEMDGDANGPVKTDITLNEGEDMLEASALDYTKRYIARGGTSGKYSLLALAFDSS